MIKFLIRLPGSDRYNEQPTLRRALMDAALSDRCVECNKPIYPDNLSLHVYPGLPGQGDVTTYLAATCIECAPTVAGRIAEARREPEPEPEPQHNNGGGYGPHPWDCPACVLAAKRRKENRRPNPHRPGTKVAARWEREQNALDWAMDLRGETYWSM